MAFFDKLNQVAKTATDKANEAIGTGKITVKIKKEEYGIEEQYREAAKKLVLTDEVLNKILVE